MKLRNKYFLMRHGEALSNTGHIISCWPEKFNNPLTPEGKKQAKEGAKALKDKNIDFIFSSDILRAMETAWIVAGILGITAVHPDARLREYNIGVLNGMPITDFSKEYPDAKARFYQKPHTGENYAEITDRMQDFLQDIDAKHQGKNILVVSHQVPLALLIYKYSHLTEQEVFKDYFEKGRMKNGQVQELN